MIKTFRGQLTDSAPGNQDRIRLQTIKGKVGYRIIKFQLMPEKPDIQPGEHIFKIFKTKQSTVTAIINFTDSDLLAVAIFLNEANTYYPTDFYTIFDNEIFNQDIYVTQADTQNNPCNYYLELEVIPLDDAGAEYTTLKDMRQA